MTEPVHLSIVVPVYKEERNIRPFLERMEKVAASITERYEIVFCLDPSPDRTEAVIVEEIKRNPRIRLLLFSRRFGQPAATMAGIELCHGDYCVVIDVDLQDPPELIREMYGRLSEGYDVVYARRRSRKGETALKRLVAWAGYKLIARFGEVAIPTNTGDFRIMSRRVIEELKRLNEGHGFLRGLVAYVGFPQAFVEYDRDARHAGTGNYNRFLGSIKIGLNGLISFGNGPLQLVSLIGLVFSVFSFLRGAWYVFQKLAGFDLTPGLPTTVLVVTFFAGVQLLSLGVMGEYVSRIYDEVKRRPRFIIHKRINFEGPPAPAGGELGARAEESRDRASVPAAHQ